MEARAEGARKDDLLRQVLDALPAAVFMVNARGKLTYVNRAAAELVTHEPRGCAGAGFAVFPTASKCRTSSAR